MRKVLFFVMFFLGAAGLSSVYGQQVVPEAIGHAYHSDIRIAKEEAIRNAKSDALDKAGVSERIFGHSTRFINDEDRVIYHHRTEIDLLTQEATVEYKQKDLSLSYTVVDENRVKATAVIRNAKVWAEEWDPYFSFSITGLSSIYEEDSKLSLQVTPTQDCYIRIFWFDLSGVNHNAEMLFPHKGLNDFKVEAGETFTCPPTDSKSYKGTKYELKLKKDDEKIDWENVGILVAAVKNETRTPDDESWEGVVRWLHSMPSNQRTYQVRQISIKKKQD